MAEWLRRGLQILKGWRKTARVYTFTPQFGPLRHAERIQKVQTRQGRKSDELMHLSLDAQRIQSISGITINGGDSMTDQTLSESGRKVLEDRDDNGFLFSNSGGLKGGVAVQVRRSLLNAGLIERLPFEGQGDEFQDGGGVHALKVTEAGRTALGQEATVAAETEFTEAHAARGAARTPRENSKQAQLIGMLRREDGATIDELCREFGWKPHTTRAAISTLPKKAGLVNLPTSEKVEGRGRVYRLPAAE